jgi:hypothetical protein
VGLYAPSVLTVKVCRIFVRSVVGVSSAPRAGDENGWRCPWVGVVSITVALSGGSKSQPKPETANGEACISRLKKFLKIRTAAL